MATIEGDELVALVRHRSRPPQWLEQLMATAVMRAGAARTPLVVLTTAGGLAYVIHVERIAPPGDP